MATTISSFQELYDILRNEIEANDGDFTDFNDGSLFDIISGAVATGSNEISELIITEFRKTFFESAHGPEITGGPDDLRNLAVDHFGEDFERPLANEATVDLNFFRETAAAGQILIPQGTIVKTEKDSNGEEQRFSTLEAVTISGLAVSAKAIADIAGSDGNVDPNLINTIESTLLDPTIQVLNPTKAAGGTNDQDDATYRETIRSLIQALAGATKKAIEGAILSVQGVSTLTLIEIERVVIDYDIATQSIKAGASFFRIPYPVAYIADENGASSQAIVDTVKQALESVRACGVSIEVLGAVQIFQDWDASFTLNAQGPNFSELQSSPTLIIDSMKDYIKSLPIGTGFSRTAANSYILSIWGPSGTNDIVNFNTNTPVADVQIQQEGKLIDRTVSINGSQG